MHLLKKLVEEIGISSREQDLAGGVTPQLQRREVLMRARLMGFCLRELGSEY